MALVPVRELRNHTADVIERARGGEHVVITVNGVPAATLAPIRQQVQKEFLTKADMVAIIERSRTPDSALEADIAAVTSETTDDLEPIR